jgi:hypothetical protein
VKEEVNVTAEHAVNGGSATFIGDEKNVGTGLILENSAAN